MQPSQPSGAESGVGASATGPSRLVLPAYGRGSLADLLPAIGSVLGVSGLVDVLGLPDASKVVLLLVDGLGSVGLASTSEQQAPVLHALAHPGRSLTTCFPSTTSTSLTSLATGLPPGRHGMVGYQFRLPGYGMLNTLDWPDRVDPRAVQRQPSMLRALAVAGVSVSHVGPRAYTSTGLTLASMAGTTYTGADTTVEKVAATAAALRADGRVLVNVYAGELDNTGHRHGVASEAWRAQLAHIDRLVEQLLDGLPEDGLLLVTGDHGMIDAVPERAVDVQAEPALTRGVEMVAGEPRARHVYSVPGAEDDVLAAWRERLQGIASVLSRAEAIDAGWFGPTDPELSDRIGDVVAACTQDGALLVAGRTHPHESVLVGHHGSLTDAEARVPLLMAGKSGEVPG